MRSRLPFLFALVALSAAGSLSPLACAKPIAPKEGPVSACTKAGQQCHFADGKIGLCTSLGSVADSVGCGDAGELCLVCMSLH